MKNALLVLSLICVSTACSREEEAPAPQAAPSAAAVPATAPAAREPADMAAAEIGPGDDTPDPCDLSGYDMSKMTVDVHERLVEQCERSKQ